MNQELQYVEQLTDSATDDKLDGLATEDLEMPHRIGWGDDMQIVWY